MKRLIGFIVMSIRWIWWAIKRAAQGLVPPDRGQGSVSNDERQP